jgi:LuxR family maltose regulon positive regulatory protein
MQGETPFPLSRTKTTAPRRRAELITRPRLMNEVHALLNKKLVLISAPAGYGKTSLLIDMAENSEIPFCWLSLDSLDQDPQRFLAYFIACIQERFPGFGTISTSMLKNTVLIEKENERLAITITNEIQQEIHEHFAIVLDDYQFIDPVPALRAFINRFIELVGEHCHLLLLSRLLPTLPNLHLLVARDLVGGLGVEDLGFLPEEISALFEQNSHQHLSPDEAREIARLTDGWVTAIALTGLSHQAGLHNPTTPAARTGIELYDYFTREILAKQPADVRDFLLLTALLDDVNIELCQLVLEPVVSQRGLDWNKLFHAIQTNNLFAIPIGTDGRNFRYHHLFQEYLQTRLQEETPQIIQQVMTRLADYYRQQRDWDKAHYIYENNGDLPARIALIEQAGTYLIQNGRIVTLANWLERLPVSILQNNPRLLSLQGSVAYTQGDTQMGISLLSQAETQFRQQGDIDNLTLTLVRRAAAYRELGDLPLAMQDAEEIMAITVDIPRDEIQTTYAAAERVKGMVLFRQGNSLAAAPLLEDALRRLVGLQDFVQIPILEMELGAIHHTLGNSEIAIRYYQSALKTWEKDGNLGWQATLMNNLAVLHHSRGEYELAFNVLEGAIDCAQRSGYTRAQALALSSLGDLLADLQETERAGECIDQALVIASQLGYSFLVYYTSVAKARIARLENRPSAAEALLRELSGRSGQNISQADEALFLMEHSLLLLYQDQVHQASDQLTRAINLYERDGRALEVCIAKLWLAAAHLALGETDSLPQELDKLNTAWKTFREPAALQIAASEIQHWLQKFHLAASDLQPFQPWFQRANEFTQQIPTIRRNLRRTSKSAFISPPHLTIQGFGPALVKVNGSELQLSDWQTRETRDLFFHFLETSASTKEEVAAVFWPDISPERLKMRFKTSLYRLRHAVGQNTILCDGERYRFNHNLDYEYDHESYEKQVELALSCKNPAETASQLQMAVNLVRGRFLADIDLEWADILRNEFETHHQANLLKLARVYLRTGLHTSVLAACQAALETDPLLEDAYLLMMRAHLGLGDRAAAARVYKTCNQVLLTELGIKPSAELEKLRKELN